MSVTSDTQPIGPDTDPQLLQDKPLSYPPAGNPSVYGPGRGRMAERVMYTVYLLAAAFMLWMLKPGGFEDAGAGLAAFTGRQLAFALLAAIILGTMGLFLYLYPLHRMIVRIDDHGVTLRSLGPFHNRPRSFVPFDKLKEVRMVADGRAPPWDVLEISLRPGTGWISWKFAALTATGTEGRKIAEEIVTRAQAAGIVVTPHKGSGLLQGVVRWSFDPKSDAGKGNATP